MFWDAQDLKKADIVIIITVAVLVLIGLLAVYSATQSNNPALQKNFTKQIVWILLGVMVAFIVVRMPMKIFYQYAYGLYFFSIFLLAIVLSIGGGQTGVHRWFVLGPIRFQPSEVAKIATLFALARFLADKRHKLSHPKDILLVLGLVALPLGLVAKEPDLGTALVFMALILPMMYWAGLSLFSIFLFIAPLITLASAFDFKSFFLAMLLITAVMVLSRRGIKLLIPNFLLNIGVGIITPILWSHLHGYQKSRILTFLGLQHDPRGLGYQVLQSKVAIGSGGFFGKGWLHGTQTQLRFLPEQHTDFIFSVVGEEFGFIGVMLVLVAFFILIWRAFNIARECRSPFISLVAMGASIILMFHVLVNTGMTVGIMPVTGLPLPFLSYGGSALLTSMILVALIINAGRRRFQYL